MTAPTRPTISSNLPPETRERFLIAIAAQVPVERIAEIHLFAPIRQGGVESGVAVVAAWPKAPVVADAPPVTAAEESETVEATEPIEATDAVEAIDVTDDAEPTEGDESDDESVDEAESPEAARANRPTVFTARYRLTLKGPDRGKWETSVVAEAEAPLVTVDAVVRGVQRRSGDVEDATRMDGDEMRAFMERHVSNTHGAMR